MFQAENQKGNEAHTCSSHDKREGTASEKGQKHRPRTIQCKGLFIDDTELSTWGLSYIWFISKIRHIEIQVMNFSKNFYQKYVKARDKRKTLICYMTLYSRHFNICASFHFLKQKVSVGKYTALGEET